LAALLEKSLLINGAKNANYLADHAADYLAHALQGQWIYFPKPRNFDLSERNRQIATLYQRGGVTYAALAERFNLSRTRISQIVQSASL
jgi:Mor family transcriptional regulator